ncbi:exodeoxyribonuclease VII large subunit [Nocardioides mangrovicus]|uniref:Exodeoxyribonuclease 7 large subunit n=1 Tax=Nocardioides mangrovicus TaxID=2478913 RepID=A0A3L8P5W2_9ACTN|nr:exodeoxyribonuclease VII large subunit [Nocardioides mangrovicus]RLV50790.1 exodeoxyribonuclease VII large subunit [Nocardioides mangrovicus]
MPMETSPEKPAPVRAVAQAIGSWVERLGAVWVEGQVTQISRRAGMRTVFLTLRDALADISMSVTCSSDLADSLATPLVEGASIVVHAKPSYYANRGTLSLQAREIRMVGLGELLARLEQRRRLLAAEGLFDPALKRPLPFLPRVVGLVTAQGSAAERDVVENAGRRWPAVQVRTAYAAMQGMNAARDVMAALERLDADPEVDVIVVARGGGSVEDLLPFSDEAVVRAVARARTPVVSAIGHEQDGPLLDLVADVRASTPTDAAKRVVPDVAEEQQRVAQLRDRVRRAVHARIAAEQHTLSALRSRPALADPRGGLADRLGEVEALRDRARRSVHHRLDRAADDLGHHLARVRSLSPLSTLRRGYAVLQTADGAVVTDPATVSAGDSVEVRVAAGRVEATVTATHAEPTDREAPDAEG